MTSVLAYTVVLTGDVEGTLLVTRLRPITIGRNADVSVEDPRASRVHTRLEVGEAGLEVVDLQSANGTVLNGERIDRAPLRDGDILRIGDSVLKAAVRAGRPKRRKATVVRGAAAAAAPADERIRQLAGEGFRDLTLVSDVPPVAIYDGVRAVIDQPVTLKVVDTEQADATFCERFVREAKVAARLGHPHIVRLFDARSVGNLLYMVLERHGQRSLGIEVTEGGPLSAERATALGIEVARALAYAHGESVIHRDVRPEHIVLSQGEGVRLSGFGLARDAGSQATKRLTRAGESLGTLGFAAPEQLEDATRADALSDIYGLGATLFFAVTGAPPARTEARREKLLEGRANDDFRQVVLRCLRRKPSERFWGAREVSVRLEGALRSLLGLADARGSIDVLLRYAHEDDGAGGIQAAGAVRAEKEKKRRAPAASAGPRAPAFHGSFAENELIELVQMLEFNQKSGTLWVLADDDGSEGTVAFADGFAIHARWGSEEGFDALLAVLGLAGGTFRLTLAPPAASEEHRLPIGPLLMEVMRLRDEAGR